MAGQQQRVNVQSAAQRCSESADKLEHFNFFFYFNFIFYFIYIFNFVFPRLFERADNAFMFIG